MKLAAITGTTHGIGGVTAREFARAGYHVLMLCRNLELAGETRDAIIAAVPGATVESLHCDLASLASVRECARQVRAQHGPISLLVNNAGMASTRQQLSMDGFELCFATNHLGPFLLTMLLLDHLPGGGRIVNVASRAHFRGTLDLERVRGLQPRYSAIAAYAQSKLANVLFTFALARRLAGSGVTTNCLHPGVVASNLLPRWLRLLKPFISREVIDIEQGARTSLYLALDEQPARQSGLYFDERQRVQAASALANDVPLQEALWAASMRWTALAAT